MKKQVVIALVALLLSGCGAAETFETISDEQVVPVSAEIREVFISLPPEAASPVLEDEEGCVYVCGDYEIYQQTLSAGDLSATARAVSGYDAEDLTMVKTMAGTHKRYDFVWATVADQGDRVGKGCILDDGNYHYVLTIVGDAQTAGEHQAVWQEVLDSFALG